MIKLTTEEIASPLVSVYVEQEKDFEGSILVKATNGKTDVELLRITPRGTVFRIVGQAEKLKELGFNIDRVTNTIEVR